MQQQLMLLFAVLFVLIAATNNPLSFSFAFIGYAPGKKNIKDRVKAFGNLVFFTMQDLEKKMEEYGNDMKKAMDTLTKQVSDGAKTDEALKQELKNISDKWLETQKELQKQIDAVSKDIEKAHEASKKSAPITEQLEEILQKNGKFQAFKERQTAKASIEIPEMKAIMLPSAPTIGAGIIQAQQMPGIMVAPLNPIPVRNLIPFGTISGPLYAFVRMSAYNNAATTVAAGALKPQSDLQLTRQEVAVRKIATHLRIAQELVEDVPGIVSFISAQAPQQLRLVEDAQLLSGDGTGENLVGLMTQATVFARPAGMTQVASPTHMDVLMAAIANVSLRFYNPTAIVINPVDIANMLLMKDTTGAYLFPGLNGPNPNVLGVPVAANSAMAAGSFLVGAFNIGAQGFDRKGLTIEFFDQDQDNAVKNLVTIVVEERLTLATYRPDAFARGTFATAKTALAAA